MIRRRPRSRRSRSVAGLEGKEKGAALLEQIQREGEECQVVGGKNTESLWSELKQLVKICRYIIL